MAFHDTVILLSTCQLVSVQGSCSARSVFFFFFLALSPLVRLQLPPWFHGIHPVAVHHSLLLPVLSGSCSDVLETNGSNCSPCTYWVAIGQFYLLLDLHGDATSAYFSQSFVSFAKFCTALLERERERKQMPGKGRDVNQRRSQFDYPVLGKGEWKRRRGVGDTSVSVSLFRARRWHVKKQTNKLRIPLSEIALPSVEACNCRNEHRCSVLWLVFENETAQRTRSAW